MLDRVGRDLKTVYAPVVQEPLPGQLASLVRRLDGREVG
ncbi:NepR family anti-sigma factor [Salinarimonas soli]|nr:NepR family anti-sigma factor [Salinarimonas soli]